VSLAHKPDAPSLTFGQSLNLNIRREDLRAAMVRVGAALGIVALTCIFATGHPIIAIWMGFAIVCWMFFVGASGDYGKHSENGEAATLPPASPAREEAAALRRQAIYEDMLRERGLELKEPMPY
jgi:hypothetical protein